MAVGNNGGGDVDDRNEEFAAVSGSSPYDSVMPFCHRMLKLAVAAL
jgi:hypothetical protein